MRHDPFGSLQSPRGHRPLRSSRITLPTLAGGRALAANLSALRRHALVLRRAHPTRRQHDRAARRHAPVSAPAPRPAMNLPGSASMRFDPPVSPPFGDARAERTQPARKMHAAGRQNRFPVPVRSVRRVRRFLSPTLWHIPASARSHSARPRPLRSGNFRSGSIMPSSRGLLQP